MIEKIKKNQFLFTELVKRDFKQKYKQTVLGMVWSMLAPMLQLLVQSLVFTNFFGNKTPNYTIYLFSGNIVFSYFREATNGGMSSLVANTNVISKINIPKYLFLLSKNVSSFINFILITIVFFGFVALDGIPFHPRFLMIIYPILVLTVFNIGVGLILSALYVMFKDVQYLYDIFLTLLTYLSAIFYTVDSYSAKTQMMFYINPIFTFIRYIRILILEARIPSINMHLLLAFYALVMITIGGIIYKKFNYKFIYYM